MWAYNDARRRQRVRALTLRGRGFYSGAHSSSGDALSPRSFTDGHGFRPALSRFDRIMAVDVHGVASGIRAAIPALRAAGGGAIVATSSVSGLAATGDPGIQCVQGCDHQPGARRRGGLGGAEHPDQRHRARGTATALTAAQVEHSVLGAEFSERIPAQRWADPREQAEVIWFLASPAASYVTGVARPLNGRHLPRPKSGRCYRDRRGPRRPPRRLCVRLKQHMIVACE